MRRFSIQITVTVKQHLSIELESETLSTAISDAQSNRDEAERAARETTNAFLHKPFIRGAEVSSVSNLAQITGATLIEP